MLFSKSGSVLSIEGTDESDMDLANKELLVWTGGGEMEHK